MNKERKIDLLYRKAKGERLNLSAQERGELVKYRVNLNEGSFLATKKNIREYVTAVDNGCLQSFCDWCYNNKKADRRRKGSSEKDIEYRNNELTGMTVVWGFIMWGTAIYWMLHEYVSIVACGLLGGLLSIIFAKFARRRLGIYIFVIPIILAYYFGGEL